MNSKDKKEVEIAVFRWACLDVWVIPPVFCPSNFQIKSLEHVN